MALSKQSRPDINNTTFSISTKLIRGSGIATIGRVLGRGAGYFAQIILARMLAPEGFGLFAIGWTILRLFSIAGHLGLDSGVVKFGGQYWQKDPLKLRNTLLVSLSGAFLSGVTFGLALYVFAPWLANEFFKKPDLAPIFRGFALTFPFATTLRVAAASSSLSGRMLYGAIAEDITQPTVQILLFFVLLKTETGLNAALLSIGLSYGISVVVSLFFLAKLFPHILTLDRISTRALIPILEFSLPAILGVTLGAFNLWGDRLLVGYFSTEANTGIYQSISILTMFTTIILSGFKIAIAPMVAQMHHANDYEGIRTLTKSLIRWALYLSMPILIFVFINANRLITELFGKEYQAGTIPLLILTVGQVFYVASGIADQIFLMTEKQKEWLRISIFIFVLTVVLDAIFIPRANLIGASLVSSTMMLLLGCMAAFRLKRYLKFWIFDIQHAKIIAVSLITTLAAYLVSINLPFSNLVNLFTTLAIICILFVVLVLLSGFPASDKSIFSPRE
ncbi:MAG TPA: oligosaccharide flippase family protein [Anaerolineales bacterium]|nr:oligosaccharide flippase family protein [Anaerolineales bacterium]